MNSLTGLGLSPIFTFQVDVDAAHDEKASVVFHTGEKRPLPSPEEKIESPLLKKFKSSDKSEKDSTTDEKESRLFHVGEKRPFPLLMRKQKALH